MGINRVRVIALLVVLIFTTNIYAQTQSASVTGSVTPEGVVRVIAHGESLQIRMEIYSATGDVVSDSGLRQGSIIDWKLKQLREQVNQLRQSNSEMERRIATLEQLLLGQLQLQQTTTPKLQ